ncbi:MAG: MBL fold metallo-hydrolase [Alphaproteobacteria bacterium]|nr:MBL fold metallo-hydrolase [Alphaproteobacteria bacterium]
MRSLLSAILVMALAACDDQPKTKTVPAPAERRLAEHGAEFKPEVIRIAEGLWVAVGYGLANSILIEGSDGAVVVDAMESGEAARRVKAEFAKLTPKPIRAVILTHYHPDHSFGARVMAEGGATIIANRHTETEMNEALDVVAPAMFARNLRQFGVLLPPDLHANAGIGPFLDYRHGQSELALARPTRIVDGEEEMTIAGIRLRIVHAPGETEDQMFVWLPERRALLPGDNLYKAFPNLYAIRGTRYRDVAKWIASLDRMRDLEPEFLVPSHTRPVIGRAAAAETLTAYRDAIQFVHDQTIRLMNKGFGPDEIATRLVLPQHLAAHPHLQEFYGKVEWSARAIFHGLLGWFDGNPARLYPLAPAERAMRLADLAKGGVGLDRAAEAALAAGDLRWAAELAAADLANRPDAAEAKQRLARVLRAQAAAETSANGRNYLLTGALELEGALRVAPLDPKLTPVAILHDYPIDSFMRAMAVRLDADKALAIDAAIQFRFTDLGRDYGVHVRRGVAEIRPGAPRRAPALRIAVDSNLWKEIAAGQRSLPAALATGRVAVEGSLIELVQLLALFRG